MLKYVIQTGKMNEIMALLFDVLDIRITFFDLQECEVEGFNIKEMSPFCKRHRKNADFNANCVACDRANLKIAKQLKEIHIYHCHAGLLEGIVPLYDTHGMYLGAIVFGQMLDNEIKQKKDAAKIRVSKNALRKSSLTEMKSIGKLLKYLSEYIIENEIVKYCNKHWVERIDDYINDHLTERITLDDLAALIRRSKSFLSHNFPQAFGMSLRDYVRKKKMTIAREKLEAGKSVKATANELGFYDEFYFSKEFKRYFGKSPKTFKMF